MAITYPLTLPTTPDFNGSAFSMTHFVAMVRSEFTGQTQAQAHQGALWRASLSLPPMKRPAAEPYIAALMSLNGRLGTFFLGDPLGRTARGSLLGTPLVNGASQTGLELITDGWTVSSNGVLLPGDYIQLGSGALTRLYKVMKQVDADGSGNATIDIQPRLRESPADGEALIFSNTKGTFRLASNTNAWDEVLAEFYGIRFDAIEAY